MGIEHPQMDAVAALFAGSADDKITANLMTPGGKTPNQRALACAIALAWARLGKGKEPAVSVQTAVAQTRDLFAAMASNGHQAVGMTFGCEEGAPDPHSELWMGALATILREARLQGIGDILDMATGYFADHVAMVRAFWTPAGVRMACARAKAKDGQALRPNWTVDSLAYAAILGLSTAGLAKAISRSLPILQDSAALFPQIVERSKTAKLKLAVPIRRWERPDGGFVAAFVEDVPMNDRCSWIVVDAAGEILDAANTLDTFTAPTGEPVVFGGVASGEGTETTGTETKTGAGTGTGTGSGTGTGTDSTHSEIDLHALAAAVRGLLLPHKQAAVKEAAAEAIENGKLADALPLVQSFGIGDGQAQAGPWKQVIATLQGAVHA